MLNHDGNLMDAASIAAITALCHFRRPDVSVMGEEITVVSGDARPELLVEVCVLSCSRFPPVAAVVRS